MRSSRTRQVFMTLVVALLAGVLAIPQAFAGDTTGTANPVELPGSDVGAPGPTTDEPPTTIDAGNRMRRTSPRTEW